MPLKSVVAPCFSTMAILLLVTFLCFSMTSPASSHQTTTATYIVFMNPSQNPTSHETNDIWYRSHLQSLSIDPDRHLLYSYSYSFLHAFAASLLPSHLPLLRNHPSVLHLLPEPLFSLHTTRSPHFLGLPPWPNPTTLKTNISSSSNDIIIGILDTGVWPESPSFSDANLPPIPSRWRGSCDSAPDFSPSLCNRKFIGARSFSRGYNAASASSASSEHVSPRDRDGHDTHTASTAAGSPVANASLFTLYAPGTARGMAPAARIASYKVCWSSGCYGSDILAGIDSAVSDGVDVLSLSLGGASAPYSRDPVAIGALAAVKKGIFVSCSAGNSGPTPSSLTNTAPWITTVGAGTLDRDFPAYADLGNGKRLAGVSLYSGEGMAIAVITIGNTNSSRLCLPGSLDPATVKGTVVLCDRGINARVQKGEVVRDAGGVGMILANTAASGEEVVADSHLLPTVAVGVTSGNAVRAYVRYPRSEEIPTVVLSFGGTVLDVRPSPVVAAFSSRGPNSVAPEILKPDLIGPGVNILAGWSGSIGPSGLAKDERRTQFNIISGTSMSCPHISGVAALLKAAHPDWSPSAIKSALMTTAYTVDNTGFPLRDSAGGSLATPLAYGSGHVDPEKALSPGLIYNITTEEYISFLCSFDSSNEHVQSIAMSSSITCSKRLKDPGDLNYPSFSVIFDTKRVKKYSRELTNVDPQGSIYNVKSDGPASINVTVKPKRLVFRQSGEKLRYSVTFTTNEIYWKLLDLFRFGVPLYWAQPDNMENPQSSSPVGTFFLNSGF